MKKRISLFVLAVLIAAVASAVEIDIIYYSDNSYTTQVGYDDTYCDASHATGGTTSNYRTRAVLGCHPPGSVQSYNCQELINGVWVDVTCP